MLLQQVAHRLLTVVREVDTVARLGGDEFVVLLEELSEKPAEAAIQAEVVARRFLHALAPSYSLASHEYHSTGSVGGTLFSDHLETVDDLLKRADLAVYQAKSAGRNVLASSIRRCRPWSPPAPYWRPTCAEACGKANWFFTTSLKWMARVDATGAEALVRWQHPRRGLISPAEFIPWPRKRG